MNKKRKGKKIRKPFKVEMVQSEWAKKNPKLAEQKVTEAFKMILGDDWINTFKKGNKK